MSVAGAQKRIVDAVSRWEGVSVRPHRFGGTEFRLGRRELGHIHADSQADIALPIAVRNKLVSEGKADPHDVLPHSGWITLRFRKEEDVNAVVELFRLSYELANGRLRLTDAGAVHPTRSI